MRTNSWIVAWNDPAPAYTRRQMTFTSKDRRNSFIRHAHSLGYSLLSVYRIEMIPIKVKL